LHAQKHVINVLIYVFNHAGNASPLSGEVLTMVWCIVKRLYKFFANFEFTFDSNAKPEAALSHILSANASWSTVFDLGLLLGLPRLAGCYMAQREVLITVGNMVGFFL
jgi:hypothetical protein